VIPDMRNILIVAASVLMTSCSLDTATMPLAQVSEASVTRIEIGYLNTKTYFADAYYAEFVHTFAITGEASFEAASYGPFNSLDSLLFCFLGACIGSNDAATLVLERVSGSSRKDGQLTLDDTTPLQMQGFDNIACELFPSGLVKCWDLEVAFFQTLTELQYSPKRVTVGFSRFSVTVPGAYSRLAVGSGFACGIGKEKSMIYCWGTGFGDYNVNDPLAEPVAEALTHTTNWKSLFASTVVCAQKSETILSCWQPKNLFYGDKSKPFVVDVDATKVIRRIASPNGKLFVIYEDGSVSTSSYPSELTAAYGTFDCSDQIEQLLNEFVVSQVAQILSLPGGAEQYLFSDTQNHLYWFARESNCRYSRPKKIDLVKLMNLSQK